MLLVLVVVVVLPRILVGKLDSNIFCGLASFPGYLYTQISFFLFKTVYFLFDMYSTYNILLTKKYNKTLVSLAAVAVANMAGLYGLLHLSSGDHDLHSLLGLQSGLPLTSNLPGVSAGCLFVLLL